MLPYSDLMTLLLAVFIVLFAVSKVDQVKATEMSKSFQKTMMVQGGSGSVLPGGTSLNPMPQTQQGNGVAPYNVGESGTDNATDTTTGTGGTGTANDQQLRRRQERINQEIADDKESDSVTTAVDSRGVVVTFNNVLLFDSGKADIKTDNTAFLLKVAKLINKAWIIMSVWKEIRIMYRFRIRFILPTGNFLPQEQLLWSDLWLIRET